MSDLGIVNRRKSVCVCVCMIYSVCVCVGAHPTSFQVRVLLALRPLSTAAWYSPRCTSVDARRAKLDTLL